MKIAIYSRKSRLSETGESVENQVQMCKDYIRLRFTEGAVTTITVFEDDGFSGKNIARPQFQKMLSLIQSGEFAYVVCYRLDRISRNVGDFAKLVEMLQTKGVSFICIKEQFDTSTPTGRAMMFMASVFSQLERETIGERVRDNMLLLSKTGRFLGGTVPLGFCSSSIACNENGKRKKMHTLTVDKKNISIIRFIFDQYLHFPSLYAVEQALARQGYRTKNHIAFTRSSIGSILKNPVYCTADAAAYAYFLQKQAILPDKSFFQQGKGILSYNKYQYSGTKKKRDISQWILSVGSHPGIISGARWCRVQSLLERDTLSTFKHRSSHALFSPLLHCALCKNTMRPKTKKQSFDAIHQAFSYVCRTKINSHCDLCNVKNLNGIQADRLIETALWATVPPDWSPLKQIRKEKQKIFARLQKKNTDFKNQISSTAGVTLPLPLPGVAVPALLEQCPLTFKQTLYAKLLERILWDGKQLHVYPKS